MVRRLHKTSEFVTAEGFSAREKVVVRLVLSFYRFRVVVHGIQKNFVKVTMFVVLICLLFCLR